MDNIKLSIITVNFNNREGLNKTIHSVTTQTCHDFEWIIIDGGSTDGSKELIEQNKEHISYWCCEQDNGIYNAMNKGVMKANGDYCLFLNSGDYLHNENVIENVTPYLKDNDFIAGSTVYVKEDGLSSIGHPPRQMSAFHIVNYTLNHQSLFIHTELLKKRPYREDLRIVSDWEQQVYEIVLADATFLSIPYIISNYMEGGFSFIHDSLLHEERKKVRHELFSNCMLGAILGDNNMKAIANHIEYGTIQYKLSLFAIRTIRKICTLFHIK